MKFDYFSQNEGTGINPSKSGSGKTDDGSQKIVSDGEWRGKGSRIQLSEMVAMRARQPLSVVCLLELQAGFERGFLALCSALHSL